MVDPSALLFAGRTACDDPGGRSGDAHRAALVGAAGPALLNLLSNVGALIFMRRGHRIPPSMLVGLMIYDVVHLTALLYLTGGPYNPFSFAYLVLIALATLVLSERQVWGLAAIAVSGSALLFLHHRPLILPGGHADHMRTHLYGMWVAFSVAAGFIVYFMVRIRRALNAREAALWKAEQAAAQRDKLASLATLAAGAATNWPHLYRRFRWSQPSSRDSSTRAAIRCARIWI